MLCLRSHEDSVREAAWICQDHPTRVLRWRGMNYNSCIRVEIHPSVHHPSIRVPNHSSIHAPLHLPTHSILLCLSWGGRHTYVFLFRYCHLLLWSLMFMGCWEKWLKTWTLKGIQIPSAALFLTSCLTSSQPLDISEPPFIRMWRMIPQCFTSLTVRMKWTMVLRHLSWFLAHSFLSLLHEASDIHSCPCLCCFKESFARVTRVNESCLCLEPPLESVALSQRTAWHLRHPLLCEPRSLFSA